MKCFWKNIAEYYFDTVHLGLLEKGAYSILLNHYYASEAPILLESGAVFETFRARRGSKDYTALLGVLRQFFTPTADGWVHNKPYIKASPIAPKHARHVEKRLSDARSARARGVHTKAQWDQLCDQHDHRCAYCGVHKSLLVGGALTKDHVIAISVGGSDCIENIAPACRSCNSAKGARVLP